MFSQDVLKERKLSIATVYSPGPVVIFRLESGDVYDIVRLGLDASYQIHLIKRRLSIVTIGSRPVAISRLEPGDEPRGMRVASSCPIEICSAARS